MTCTRSSPLHMLTDFFANWVSKKWTVGELPLKAWKDCLRCPKFQACDEIAMLKRLKPGAPEVIVPQFTQIEDTQRMPVLQK